MGTGTRVSLRIGIASGLVVVGNPGVSGGSSSQIVIGEAPNLAARLQSAAQPGTAMVCSNTRSLIRRSFKLEYLGAASLRGYKTPQGLWQVDKRTTPQTRLRAARLFSPLHLVGREKEYARLVQLWKQAGRRDARVALISGETGTGKTKLLEALCRQVSGECSGQLILQCSPCNADAPLHTYLARLLAADGLLPGNIPAGKILPEKPVANSPYLIVLEDAHHCSVSSLALINKLVTLVRGKQVLLAISHRMPFQPAQTWCGQRHVEHIHLEPLSRAVAGLFIQRSVGAGQIPARIVAEIIARCDGIPLFLEELTSTALETRHAVRGAAQATGSELKIPDKVWAVLMARLDRQPPASREAMQIGAVLGREFSYSLLAEIWPHNRDRLDEALHSLCRSGELLKTGPAGNTGYRFRWVLMREVAYQNTLRRVRQNLYRRIMRVQGQYVPVRNYF